MSDEQIDRIEKRCAEREEWRSRLRRAQREANDASRAKAEAETEALRFKREYEAAAAKLKACAEVTGAAHARLDALYTEGREKAFSQ